ncbi:MAG: STAS domain-containing protein [Spirochaetales bacterium]|nr:STAS domain-containing protein [Spirochaetales bacterium]
MFVNVKKGKSGSIISVDDTELTGETVDELKEEAVRLIDQGEKNIILDLSKTEYIDSSGIGKLLFINKKLISFGGKMEIINITDSLFNFFETLALDKVIKIIR